MTEKPPRASYLEEAAEMWDDTFRWDPRWPRRTYRSRLDRLAIRGLAATLLVLDKAVAVAKPVLRPYWERFERGLEEYDEEANYAYDYHAPPQRRAEARAHDQRPRCVLCADETD